MLMTIDTLFLVCPRFSVRQMIEVDALIADTDGEIAEALGNDSGMIGTSNTTTHLEHAISIESFFQGPYATMIIKYVRAS